MHPHVHGSATALLACRFVTLQQQHAPKAIKGWPLPSLPPMPTALPLPLLPLLPRRTALHLAGKTSRPDLPYPQQLAVGRKVASHFSGMLPALGICASSQAAIEGRFRWQLAVLQQHLQQLPYLLSSSSPCIADFGLMGPLYARELK